MTKNSTQKIGRAVWLALWLLLTLLVACSDQAASNQPIPLPITPISLTIPAINPSPSPRPTVIPSIPASISPASVASIPTPLPTLPASGVGLNLYLYGQSDRVVGQTLGWLRDLRAGWVRLPLYWNEIEPTRGQRDWRAVDQAVTTLNRAGIKVMLNVIHCPAWAALRPERPGLPRDMNDFADFMREVAGRYRGQVVAYEVWNEPNLEREAGPVQAGAYVELLKAGYGAIKGADPAALVVTGGLTPTGVNNPQLAVDDVQYLKQFYAYNGGEARRYYDVLGAHPGSSQNPPDTLWPDRPGPGPGWLNHPSFYFRRIEQIRQVMVENGESAKKVWLTEFGWASTPHPAAGFGFAALVSEDQQATYLSDALTRARQDYDWVGQMFIFQLNMALPELTPDPTDERVAWGLIRRDGSKRPSFLAVQNFISRQP